MSMNIPIKKKPKRLTPAEQSARFKEVAKAAGADESPDAMDKAFRKLDSRKSVPKKN